MFEQTRVAPSILSADLMHMEQSIRALEKGGADFIHVDVMDGHFVPNITLGVPLVKQLSATTKLPLDVHLMVTNPLEQIPWFIDAGADILVFHCELYEQEPEKNEQAISLIKQAGLMVGMSCKPATPVSHIKPYITELDMVLVMSVNPGFSGQSYIEGSEDKVAEVVKLAKEAHVSPLIEVDGGIGLETAARVSKQGADVLVAGNAIFKESDVGAAIHNIRRTAQEGRLGA